jgi:hypothetical protein
MTISQRGQVERQLAELDRATRLSRLAPAPPRAVKGAGGILSWNAPHPSSPGVYTHFRVYANGDGDDKLVRQLPADQLFLSDGLTGDSIFVSTFNATTGAESSRIPMVGTLAAAVAPPVTSADSDIYPYLLTSTGITLITYAAPAKDGDFLTVDIRIPLGVPPTNIYWIEWGGTFDLDVPNGLNDVPGARNLFFFTSIGLKWTMLSYRGYVPE